MAKNDDWREQLRGKTVHFVLYCHADWQWEQSRLWHVERYALFLRECLPWFEGTGDFSIVLDNVAEFFEPVWQRLNPAEREQVRHWVQVGRIGIAPAGISNGRPTHVGDETFVRDVTEGRRFFRRAFSEADLGVFQSVDVGIGHSQMPQLLRLAGFDAYRAWRPEAVLDAEGVPRQFLWQGLDGSAILVMRGPYGSFYTSADLPMSEPDWPSAARRFYDEMLAPQLASGRSPTSHLFLCVGCDDTRPFRTHDGDQPYDLPAFLAQWRQREEVAVVFDRPCDVRDAILSERERLATVAGALDGAECGYNMAWGGRDGLWPWRTGNDLALVEAERWAGLAHWHGGAYPAAALATLWREHFTYQAHAEETAFAEDFAALLDVAHHVRYEATGLGREARRYLVERMGGGDRFTRYLFNPHSWPTSRYVEVYHPCVTPTAASLEAADDAGEPLPCQVLRPFHHPRFVGALNDATLLVRADLPAMAACRVRVRESGAPLAPMAEPGDRLETAHLCLDYADGALRAVELPGTGVRFFSPDGSPWPALAFHETGERGWYGPRLDRRRVQWQPERGEWLEAGPLRWRHVSRGIMAHFDVAVCTDVYADAPRLDVSVRLFDRSAGRAPAGFAALWLALPEDGALLADVPFGVEERHPERYLYMDRPGSAATGGRLFERPRLGQFWARSWVRWSAAGQTLGLVSADGGVHYLWEPGRLGHALGRFVSPAADTWEARAWPDETTVSANADRYRGHEHRFSYSLLFGDAGAPVGDLVRFAAERRLPAIVEAPDHEGAAAAVPGLVLDGPAVLSAAYWEGGRYVVRFHECQGSGGEVVCRLPGPAAGVQAVDFEGAPLDLPVSLQGNEVRLCLRPWQIVTLAVTP